MQLLGEQMLRTVRHTPALVRRGVGEAASLASRLLRNPVKPVEDAIHYVESLRRVLGHTPAPGSPLLATRSASWHLETHEVPLADLKAAAQAADASLNDAYIAALLGAFRRYHEHFGVDIDAMPVAFPISLRRGDDPLGGNRFAGVRLAGPVGVVDPEERIRRVHSAVQAVRAEPAVASLDKLLGALSRAPTPQIVQVMLQIGEDNDLQASNIPGIPFEMYLAGAKVLRMYPIGPLPGCAAMVTMLSHNGICCIGANLDPAAVTAPDLFAKYMAEGFEEVLDVGR